jgi:predicted DNA-binding transcriptional regulator AlpA
MLDTHNNHNNDDQFLTSGKLCSLLGVSTQSIFRWCRDPALGFPQPIRINGRRYWPRQEVLAWMNKKKSA